MNATRRFKASSPSESQNPQIRLECTSDRLRPSHTGWLRSAGAVVLFHPDPGRLWFLAKDKSNGIVRDRKLRDRRGEVLFIDARKLGFMVDHTRKEFSDADIAQIAETYHAWRLGEGYADVPGFCKSASLEEIRSHAHALTPGRYVGTEAEEEDETPFAERFNTLQEQLEAQFAKTEELTGTIQARLRP